MKNGGYAIAIDGPVAAGKGTVAGLLASKLPGFHLNTGAMYRCLALYCLEHGISPTDKAGIITALSDIRFDLDGNRVLLNRKDVTEAIKTRAVTQLVAKIAAIGEVRTEMVKRQREIGLSHIAQGTVVIAEGRDAATKIFPDARLKIFLTARAEIRAKRRFDQMGGENNSSITFDQILQDTKERDYKDVHREVDPLVSNPEEYGYFVLDDSSLTEEETIASVLKEIQSI